MTIEPQYLLIIFIVPLSDSVYNLLLCDLRFPLMSRNEDALESFNNANFYLRGNKLINYQQLGLKYKLYLCEVK